MVANTIKVFLSFTDGNQADLNVCLSEMPKKAGIEVLSSCKYFENDLQFSEEINGRLEQASCSLHFIGNIFGRTSQSDPSVFSKISVFGSNLFRN